MRHCRTCTCPPVKRKAIAKVSRRKPIKILTDGTRTLAGGYEKCVTKAAWQKRREEVWKRDNTQCQQQLDPQGVPIIGVFAVADVFGGPRLCGNGMWLSDAHIHHIRKRSVGRDDRPENLVTLCPKHHELYDSKPQWSKKP